jgi:hypothetical protein
MSFGKSSLRIDVINIKAFDSGARESEPRSEYYKEKKGEKGCKLN